MFNALPPTVSRPFLPLLRVKAGQTLRVRIAGSPVRTSLHYREGRSHPCIGATHHCRLCDLVGPGRYYAYWPIRGSTGQPAFVELTELAEFTLLSLIEDEENPTGLPIQISRPSGRRNNPLEISRPYAAALDELHRRAAVAVVEPSEIHRTLLRLWSLPERDPGTSENDHARRCADILSTRFAAMAKTA